MNSKHSLDVSVLRDSVQIRAHPALDTQIRDITRYFVHPNILDRVDDAVFTPAWLVLRSAILFHVNVEVVRKL